MKNDNDHPRSGPSTRSASVSLPAPLGSNGIRSNAANGTQARFRLALVSLLSAGIGLLAGGVAYVLYRLIGLFTNIFFFHRLDDHFTSARLNQLGLWVILIPVVGGLIVSQIITLYLTPVVYTYMAQVQTWLKRGRQASQAAPAVTAG